MKQILNSGHCLTIGTHVSSSDSGLNDGFIYSTLSNGEQVCLYTRGSGYNHAMTIVGYDDNIWYDLNGNGITENFEKGAFKLANSWGANWRNNGYIWVMYDALNLVSNVSSSDLNPIDRLPFMQINYYNWINVENHTPQLTVEITIQQKNRGDFTVLLGRSDTINSIQTTAMTIIRPLYSGQIGFNGTPVSSDQTRTFIFDYTGCHNRTGTPLVTVDCDLYDGNDKTYWVNVLSTTKSATGMKIIKKNTTNNMIEEIYYVVVFGDVIGNGIVGNGIIDSQDSLAVLQHSVQTSVLGVISQLAADVDHDDDIDASDAQIILQYSVGKTVINQNFTISVVPDDCYYLDPVIF